MNPSLRNFEGGAESNNVPNNDLEKSSPCISFTQIGAQTSPKDHHVTSSPVNGFHSEIKANDPSTNMLGWTSHSALDQPSDQNMSGLKVQ